jgi:enoyl-CoA hydratase/carnithine racemase
LLSGYAFSDLNTQIHAAVDENARIRTTPDFREGLNAFLEKRKPNWQG